MRPKAILLDMDDTIISYDHGIDLDLCWKRVCSRHLRLDDARIGELITEIKRHAKWYWSDPERHRTGRLDLDKARTEIVASALRLASIHEPAASRRIAVDYGVERDHEIQPYPGAVETLRQLRDKGFRLALLTNGAKLPQRNKIERFGLAPFFDCILIEEEFGAGKPDERIYLHALDRLGAAADETWMVGDNYEWEIAAPQKLGIKGIWINPKRLGHPSPELPYRTVSTLSDILPLLDETAVS
ncbi:HAD family hydrolase [Paenibacillus humicola]|uniref:HAD family hydrolase n=1 Tax=Paenibacillus humicola TaxID=3110540 RepID=UPI00237AE111|nr:HAD family hydrolase [Paenibacillus humicola]